MLTRRHLFKSALVAAGFFALRRTISVEDGPPEQPIALTMGTDYDLEMLRLCFEGSKEDPEETGVR